MTLIKESYFNVAWVIVALEIRTGFLLNLLTVCDPPEDPKFIQYQLKSAFKLVAMLNNLMVFDSGHDSRIVMKEKEVSLTANHQCVMSSKCLGTGHCFPGTFLSCSGMVAFHLSS